MMNAEQKRKPNGITGENLVQNPVQGHVTSHPVAIMTPESVHILVQDQLIEVHINHPVNRSSVHDPAIISDNAVQDPDPGTGILQASVHPGMAEATGIGIRIGIGIAIAIGIGNGIGIAIGIIIGPVDADLVQDPVINEIVSEVPDLKLTKLNY